MERYIVLSIKNRNCQAITFWGRNLSSRAHKIKGKQTSVGALGALPQIYENQDRWRVQPTHPPLQHILNITRMHVARAIFISAPRAILFPRRVREVRFLISSHLAGEVAPPGEFYSNCCPVRERHSHRSPGDCNPPTTTSRSIITTSSTILISSTSPQLRFEYILSYF